MKSLMERSAKFMIKNFTRSISSAGNEMNLSGYNPNFATSDNPLGDDLALAIGNARLIAEKRGQKVPDNFLELVKDNLKFINTTDPALGDSTGFGIHPDNTKQQEVQNNADSNNNDSNSKGVPVSRSGIRKIGGLKTT